MKNLAKAFIAAIMTAPLGISSAFADASLSDTQISQALGTYYGLIDLPSCRSGNRAARYEAMSGRALRADLGVELAGAYRAGGFSRPVIVFDADYMSYLPPLIQSFVLHHECQHIQRGHVNTNPSSAAQRQEFESEADCHAIASFRSAGLTQRALDQIKYYNYVIDQIAATPTHEVDARNANLQTCYDSAPG